LGCRSLTVINHVVVAKVWDARTFVELRAGAYLSENRRASFEGMPLRGHRLRFANLEANELFAADLAGAELQQANLDRAQLQGANLTGANLKDANLTDAMLHNSDLDGHQQWDQACGTHVTLPDGIHNLKVCPAKCELHTP
jgi:uncharacterized protein YjbI with pentapeptide repeats